MAFKIKNGVDVSYTTQQITDIASLLGANDRALFFDKDKQHHVYYDGSQIVDMLTLTQSMKDKLDSIDISDVKLEDLFVFERDINGAITRTTSLFDFELPASSKVGNTIHSVNTREDMFNYQNPYEDMLIYVQEWDSTYKYENSNWVQCGENTILREGLSLGFISAIEVKAG